MSLPYDEKFPFSQNIEDLATALAAEVRALEDAGPGLPQAQTPKCSKRTTSWPSTPN